MPKGHKRHELSDRMATQLSNEHAGLIDYVEELSVYVEKNGDDKWAVGQLKWSRKRIRQLTLKLGLADNRQPR